MLARSDNFYAEQLLRAIGVHSFGTGSIQAGTQAESKVLHELGVPLDRVHLVDASGLAESNRISALQLATLLDHEARSSMGDVFYRALPAILVAGTVGSQGTSARAKDGHLSDVSALAGYVSSRDRGRLAFAFIANRKNLLRAKLERQERRIIARLAQL
jgi:D-alanyl-D-alanine carboxypeptidase/D-alanyl-D-alanine-endopeptidase (penicillin-binding protein 4)